MNGLRKLFENLILDLSYLLDWSWYHLSNRIIKTIQGLKRSLTPEATLVLVLLVLLGLVMTV